MRGIVKQIPGVLANDQVDLTVEAGEIHALLGENGAGKSTLMQVLYGLYQMDTGAILIDGRTRSNKASPRDAIALGIGMVHQEFMLVSPFTVAENAVLGGLKRKPPAPFLQSSDRASQRLRSLSTQVVTRPSIPRSRVSSLPIGVQQRVEILKLLYRDARILVLDEPTAVLTPPKRMVCSPCCAASVQRAAPASS